MNKIVFVFLIGFVLQLARSRNGRVECFIGEKTAINCNYCNCNRGHWVCESHVTKDCKMMGLPCTPGETHRLKCSECRCSDRGTLVCRDAKCTNERKQNRIACFRDDYMERDCNICSCSGYDFDFCTKMLCPPTNYKENLLKCFPGSVRVKGCTEIRCDTRGNEVMNSRHCYK